MSYELVRCDADKSNEPIQVIALSKYKNSLVKYAAKKKISLKDPGKIVAWDAVWFKIEKSKMIVL